MAEVSIRDLRNSGGEVVDRARRGEPITITRAGRPVARLTPLSGPSLSATALVQRWRRLPELDAASLRADLDAVLDGRV